MNEAAKINHAKAGGDYTDSGETNKYPSFEADKPKVANKRIGEITFTSVINAEVSRRSSGKTASPVRTQSISKYHNAVEEFARFRKSDDLTTVTAREADAWVRDMLDKAKLSNRTIKQRLQNLKTVIEWARQHSLGDLFPQASPLEVVIPPSYQAAPSDQRTLTLEEARTILKAARQERSLERRWLPWLCAYSGARINEVAQLTPNDFFQVGNDWFFKLTTMGGKTLKTQSSERRVPIHQDLLNEGLIDLIAAYPGRSSIRIFPTRSQGNVRDWIRNTLKIERKDLAPNHGWRHLFEDMCRVGGIQDSAKDYVTGRATGNSAAGYGKSEAMLPGLAREIEKIPSYMNE
ncbi:hypothetical protein [Brucella sp.]|uniref:hypothetical protein n=1 Tax=Brucella sp. TaxID=52132 RepID=UPI0028AF9650|nr:hypothetical protein [Brucella sp.]